MKILNVISTLDPRAGGPIDGTLRLSEAWRAAGHTVANATLDPPGADDLAAGTAALGARARPAAGMLERVHDKIGGVPTLTRWLRANAPTFDAVVVHALWNASTLAARLGLVGGPTPWFVFPHGALDPWFRRTYPAKHLAKSLLWRVNEGVLMNRAAAVLFTTEEEARLATQAFRPWRIRPRVVGFGSMEAPDGAERQTAAFRAACPELGNRRFLLFLSRIHPKKGCDLLIDAFAAEAARDPDLDLVIAGPDQLGWRTELVTRAEALGIGARVHWPGMIEGDAKWGAFRAADAFVLPSHSENFGVVVAEALSCGTPVLITDKVNLWREVADARAGLVAGDTPAGIAELLVGWRTLDADARARMRVAARACWDRHFRFDRAAARMIALFEEARAPAPGRLTVPRAPGSAARP